MIPFLDLKKINENYRKEFIDATSHLLDSGTYILGNETESFEKEFAAFCETQHCIGVGNGLDALKLALLAHDIGPGDEVIVPSHTFIATWLAVSQVGATPIPAEPSLTTYNIDPLNICKAITKKTKAIIPVHLYGRAAELEEISAIAAQHKITIIEDAAQAHGACYQNKRIGNHMHTVAWSFYPGKNLGALGDGGAITTHNDAIAEKIRELRNYGSQVKYEHKSKGFNSRLDELQAAFLRIKLRDLDQHNKLRQRIAAIYLDELSGLNLILPSRQSVFDSVWHLFVIQVENRELIQAKLKDAGISTLIHYPRAPHLQPAYENAGFAKGSLPIAEHLQNTVLSLPISQVQTDIETQAVINALKCCSTSLKHL